MANTVIQLKHSTVTSNVPSSLANGEISINSRDGKFFYSTPAGSVITHYPYLGPAGLNKEIQFNDSGTLGSNSGLSFDKANGELTVSNTLILSGRDLGVYANASFATANSKVKFSTSPTAPTSPQVGDIWYYTTNDVLYEYLSDGTNQYWFDIQTPTLSANASNSDLSAGLYANSSFLTANSAASYANAAFATANNSTDLWVRGQANNAYNAANSAGSYANSAFAIANNNVGVNTTQNTNITVASTYANAAFIQANTPSYTANSAASYANSAFSKANNALANTTGTFSGDLTTTGNVSVGGDLAVTGNVTANNLTSKTTGSWTVATGTNTYSITVPASGTYQIWVRGNIPNGIIVYNATAVVTNTNVPVVGAQYAWVYNGGGSPIDFTSIPNQFVGTANTVVRSSTAPSATTNKFDFGINNTSGSSQAVQWGYVTLG